MVVNIEVDSIPKQFHQASQDWSAFSITRSLAPPLFVESKREIMPEFALAERISDCEWEITFIDHSIWENGKSLSSKDLFHHLSLINKHRFPISFLLSMFKTVSINKKNEALRITTKFPIAQIERILANPAFSPRISHDFSTYSKFFIEKQSDTEIIMRSALTKASICLLLHQDCLDLFENRVAHFSGPMTINPSDWATKSKHELAHIVALDFLYTLELPTWISKSMFMKIDEEMDREIVCSTCKGFVMPCDSLTDIWKIKESPLGGILSHWQQCDEFSSIRESHNSYPLLYTNFCGNKEIANAVAVEVRKSTNISLYPQCVPYDDLFSPKIQDYFRITIKSSIFPHPASGLITYYLGLENDKLRNLIRSSFAEPDLGHSHEIAIMAEKLLKNENSYLSIVIGNILGCIRSRTPNIYCPPSGWIDYFPLLEAYRLENTK